MFKKLVTLAAYAAVVALSIFTSEKSFAGHGSPYLYANEYLVPGQYLVSSNGRYHLVLQGDGNLVAYKPGGVPYWWSGTSGRPALAFFMQGDGNAVLYSTSWVPLWYSRTSGSGFYIHVTDTGLVEIVGSYGAIAPAQEGGGGSSASSGADTLRRGDRLLRGESLRSNNGRYRFTFQSDGNLVVYRDGTPTWASMRFAVPDSLVLQGDGNLVAYTNYMYTHAYWASHTNCADRLVMQDNGILALYCGSSLVWGVGSQ